MQNLEGGRSYSGAVNIVTTQYCSSATKGFSFLSSYQGVGKEPCKNEQLFIRYLGK